jgi:hypothetical protein
VIARSEADIEGTRRSPSGMMARYERLLRGHKMLTRTGAGLATLAHKRRACALEWASSAIEG